MPNVQAQVTAKGTASSAQLANSLDVQFTANPLATSGLYNGAFVREMTCTYSGQPMNQEPLAVYDAAPQVMAVQQFQPLWPGSQGWITIWGTNFGSNLGQILVCLHGSSCTGENYLAANPSAPPYGVWSTAQTVDGEVTNYGQINALITAASYDAVGSYDVGVRSAGNGSEPYYGGPNPQTGSTYQNGVTVAAAPTPPTVSISGDVGVPLGSQNSFSVQVSGGTPPVRIKLAIQTTTGSGSAQFSDGTTSQTITGPTTVSIQGVQVSSTANNIALVATDQASGAVLATFLFSVVTVTISINNSGQPALDDAARVAFLQGAAALGAGVVQLPTNTSPQTCAVGVQFVGTVSPSNYTGTITLRRRFPTTTVGELYQGQVQYLPTYFAPGGGHGPGDDDTSYPPLLDSDPQSGNSGGHVYDIDVPGIGLASDAIYRYRANFLEYAVLGDRSSTVKVSADFPWWAAVSCTQDSVGDLRLSTDVPNDNQAGSGTTPITWNLQ